LLEPDSLNIVSFACCRSVRFGQSAGISAGTKAADGYFRKGRRKRNYQPPRPSGGDASHDGGARRDAPLAGEIEVSADIASSQVTAVRRSLGDAGAIRVSSR